MIGTLSVVGTPIGNLGDFTPRAAQTLQACDAVVAEDTRHTGSLLHHYGIKKPLISCHEHNESHRIPSLLTDLAVGKHLALVSDAGMPTISDPGYRLVQAARNAGANIQVIPGVSAITTALAGSGLPTHKFLFLGFLPHKPAQRRKLLSSIATLPFTLIFFESPYRLLKSMTDIHEILGNRQVAVARELTKKFEEFLRGDVSTVLTTLSTRTVKGEITLLVHGATDETDITKTAKTTIS